MPDFAHIASSFATDPLASLMLAIPLSFALIVVSERIWWVHGPFALVLLIVSILFLDQRHLALDSFLVGLFAFPALPGHSQPADAFSNRDSLVFSLRARRRNHLRSSRSSAPRHTARQAIRRPGSSSCNHHEGQLNETPALRRSRSCCAYLRPDRSKGRRCFLGLPGSPLRCLAKSVLAARSLLRAPDEEADRCNVEAGI